MRIRELLLKNVGKAQGTIVVNFTIGPKDQLDFEVFESTDEDWERFEKNYDHKTVHIKDRPLWKGPL